MGTWWGNRQNRQNRQFSFPLYFFKENFVFSRTAKTVETIKTVKPASSVPSVF
jgi:hypothetical protein